MSSTATIQQLYIALYGRPADPGGLAYWTSRLDEANGDLGQIITAFVDSDETSERYADLPLEARLDGIVTSSFGREASPAEQAAALEAIQGGQTLGQVVLGWLATAESADAAVLNNRVEVAEAFSQQVASSGVVFGSQGIDAAAAMLLAVSADVNVAQYIQEQVAQQVAELPAVQPPEPVPTPEPSYEELQVELVKGNAVFTFSKQSELVDGVSAVRVTESEIDAFEAVVDQLIATATSNFGDIVTFQTGDDRLELVTIEFVGNSPLSELASLVGYDGWIDFALFNGALVTAEMLGITEQEFFWGDELFTYFGYQWPWVDEGDEVVSRPDGEAFTVSVVMYDSLDIANLHDFF